MIGEIEHIAWFVWAEIHSVDHLRELLGEAHPHAKTPGLQSRFPD